LNSNDESTRIGTGKRVVRDRDISYVMEAMPIPKAWNMTQPAAKGRGNLRLAKGTIAFVRLDTTVTERLLRRAEREEEQPLSPVELDPADRLLKKNQKRKVHNHQSSIDLFDLERLIKSDRSVSSGRYAEGYELRQDRRLAAARYRSKKEAEKIRSDLNGLTRRLKFRIYEVGAAALLLSLIELLPAFGLTLPETLAPGGNSVIYPVISLLGLGFVTLVSGRDIGEGLKSILERRFSTLTAISAAITAELIHLVYMISAMLIARRPSTVSFAAPVCIAVLIYTVNRMMHTSRVARGFTLASRGGIHNELMAADDSPIAADLRLASGSSSARIAYMVRTRHLSNYFRNACREDRCNIMMSRVYPVILILSAAACVVSSLVGFFQGGSVPDAAFTALCSSLVIGIPITGLLGMEIPLSRICRMLRKKGALLNGWNAVDKFGNTDAFAVNTTELFPRGSIRVRKSFAVNDMEIEDITSVAASVLMSSGGALAEVFGELIRDDPRLRLNVDSLTYENELGITAWIKNKKVLVGNRHMMELHRVLIPGGGLARLDEFDAMRKNECFQMLYVAVNSRLMGVYMLEYKAALSARNALLQLIEDGTGIVVYTCDANINIPLIRSVFDIPPRFISIMSNEGSSVYDSVTFKVTEAQEALIATDGSLRALSSAIRAAALLKNGEGMSLMIQSICFVLGFLLVAGLCCVSPYSIDAFQIIIMQLVFIIISLLSVIRALK
jgi:Cation transport ATPase